MSTAERHSIQVGFCETCGIIREDVVGLSGTRIPITDCGCTARLFHREHCLYVEAASSPIDVGGCSAHGNFPCEMCDCTCEGPEPEDATKTS